MTLLTTETLRVLYDLANAPGAQEHETITIWEHLPSKIYFYEEPWIVAQQKPPSDSQHDRKRRIDFNICIVNPNTRTLDIVAVVEGKGAHTVGPAQIEMVEGQAYQACEARCRYSDQTVYALTVKGTLGRVFRYRKPSWTSLTGDPNGEPDLTNYIDANTQMARALHRCFLEMRGNRASTYPQAYPAIGASYYSSPGQSSSIPQVSSQSVILNPNETRAHQLKYQNQYHALKFSPNC